MKHFPWLALFVFFALLTLAVGCPSDDDDDVTDDDDSATDDDDDTEPPGLCDELGLEAREFDDTGPEAYQRWQPAGDFTVPLRDGSDWTLSEQWTGCESYVFLPHWLTVSEVDDTSWWLTGVGDLLERSPANVHYFFVAGGSEGDDGLLDAVEVEIDDALAGLDTDEADWWRERLHVVDGPSGDVGGLVEEMFSGSIAFNSILAYYGFGIDRAQRLRTLGYPPAVEAYNASLSWPWETRLYSAAAEAEYFNFEAEREVELATVDATVIEVFGGSLEEEYVDGTLSLPDAATMAGFDTLEIDVQIECPDRDTPEIGNCGAWDYLAYTWLYDEDDEAWLEMGRYITTYHRESRWVVDGSHSLPWLADGGDRTVRFQWAPSWNTQPSYITMSVRLSNQGKPSVPAEVIPLFTGGGISSTYNDDRPPMEVDIPADAVRVELVSIATGHGMDSGNCAEFCNHAHTYGIGSDTWSQAFEDAGSTSGCADTVDSGTVPNQAGTWWTGRGGWCPGRRVDPFVADVTDSVTPGQTATVSYEISVTGSAPQDDQGSAELRSWLVISR